MWHFCVKSITIFINITSIYINFLCINYKEHIYFHHNNESLVNNTANSMYTVNNIKSIASCIDRHSRRICMFIKYIASVYLLLQAL